MENSFLAGKTILLVEDEYFLAEEASQVLARQGVHILGPVANVRQGLALLAEGQPDGALLDINLDGEMVYGLADALEERDIPFLFATGYARDALPARFSGKRLVHKPVAAAELQALFY